MSTDLTKLWFCIFVTWRPQLLELEPLPHDSHLKEVDPDVHIENDDKILKIVKTNAMQQKQTWRGGEPMGRKGGRPPAAARAPYGFIR